MKKWLARLKHDYYGFERPTESADMGRDAVGFLSPQRYDGEWHNYQCKQLRDPLGSGEFTVELGKMFYYASAGEFTLPTRYIFVAPNAAVRPVKKLFDMPSLIGDFLLKNWESYCLKGISTSDCPLTPEIEAAIRAYDFSKVELWKASELVEQPYMRAVMHEHIDIDPGEAPRMRDCDVPVELSDEERPYVGQLVTVFAEASGIAFQDHDQVAADTEYGPEMIFARRNYLERNGFRRHFRDSLPADYIDAVDEDVRVTVITLYRGMKKAPLYGRLTSVLTAAVTAPMAGALGRHNRVTAGVRQGVCHHLANTGTMPWA